jgi:hypothetical protein
MSVTEIIQYKESKVWVSFFGFELMFMCWLFFCSDLVLQCLL